MEKPIEEKPVPEKPKKEYVKPKCETHEPLDHVGWYSYTYYTYYY